MARGSGSGMPPHDPAYPGQREYTSRFLRVYDPLVLEVYCRLVWRCPAARLEDHYAEHLRPRHLDVGPGTGRFLARAALRPDAELTLLDPNPDVLAYAARRLHDRDVTLVNADVCKPLALDQRFESVGLNLVLHCLPHDHEQVAVRNLARVLEPGGVLFGSTVLGSCGSHTAISRRALWALNRRGAFDNLDSSPESVRTLLADCFRTVHVEVQGTVAIFTASRPR